MNATSSQENSIPEQVQVYTKVSRRSKRLSRQPEWYVGHIVTDNVDTRHHRDTDPLTYNGALNDFNSRRW